MNKPAHKEPSMDEILSSIRQIIADDDAAGVPRKAVLQAAAPMQATPAPAPASADNDLGGSLSDVLEELEPLALSRSQIVADEEPEPEEAGLSFDDILKDTASAESGPRLVEADDVAFEPDDAGDETEAFAAALGSEAEEAAPAPAPSAAPSASSETRLPPLPDPTLSDDLADQLLAPATNAAVRHTFAKLNNLGLGTQGLTIEAMIRDMLRPMLKEWLDENLPSVVERMVEKEIARVSRGE